MTQGGRGHFLEDIFFAGFGSDFSSSIWFVEMASIGSMIHGKVGRL